MTKALLVLASIASLACGSATFAADIALKAPPPAQPSFWFSAEYLLWSAKGDRLPALATTSPAGTALAAAGVLGQPGTSVLFGDSAVNDGWRSGARFSGGYWFDSARTIGVQASAFGLADARTSFTATSDGTTILARPFLDVTTNAQNAWIIGFPGLSTGNLTIEDTSRLYGANAAVRKQLCTNCFGGPVDALVGYRFVHLGDRLNIVSGQISTNPLFPGATLSVVEEFSTRNNFHGVDLGLTGTVSTGPWSFRWLAKVAVGATLSDVSIAGSNTITPAGGTPTTTAGGILAQPSNIGSFSSSRLSVSPELSANIAYRIADNARIFAGYNFMYWSGVVRPGGVIDTGVNLNTPGGPARPAPLANTSDYWAHGLNVGLAVAF
jgi:hypothetical protein